MNKILLIVMTAMVFAGCKKSSDNSKTTPGNAALTGKWTIVADTAETYENGTLTGSMGFNVTPKDFFQFNADGSGSTNDAEDTVYIVNYNYKLAAQVITFNYPAQSGMAAYAQNATIKLLTANKLTIYFDGKYTDQGNTEDDAEIVYMTK